MPGAEPDRGLGSPGLVSGQRPGRLGERPSAVGAFEARLIREALDRSGGNRTAAARELGIHKTTLHRKIRKLGIELPARDGRSARTGARAGRG